ncbi:hypothetical protein ACFWBI_37880 [Streptomyces sp. NPDC059982]
MIVQAAGYELDHLAASRTPLDVSAQGGCVLGTFAGVAASALFNGGL